jgi:two-component system nitrate/nitrite response regulator NarL
MIDLRLLIVAPDPLARAGLSTLLTDQPGSIVIGQTNSSDTLPDELETYRPDIIIWDLGWEPEEHLGLLADVIGEEDEGGPAVIVLLPDEEQAAGVWGAGVQAILLRETTAEQLLSAITAVDQGLTVLAGDLSRQLLSTPPTPDIDPSEELTDREREVLQLVAEGLTNKAIAQALSISEHTVKFHINTIMGKLNAPSRTAAVVRATRLGLILL